MKNSFGNNIIITLFGESHGKGVGAVLDGLTPGLEVDEKLIAQKLLQRRAGKSLSTARNEADNFSVLSGVFNGKTTGTPLCIFIPNEDRHSGDYTYGKARPGHADFAAFEKYHGFEDFRGGGHFSGRITAGLVAAAAVLLPALNKKGIYIGSHISRCAGIADRAFCDLKKDIAALSEKDFPALDENASQKMQKAILDAKADLDSVGGVLETAITGMPGGVGEPWFDSVESVLSHILFSVPAVKGVEFGKGFELADMRGSVANDAFETENGCITTKTNNNGGINGGITNGMPIIVRTAVKPTPSIAKEQQTVDFVQNENTKLSIHGRHDPCIVHRARAVVDAVCAIAVFDLLVGRYGTDTFLSEKEG